MYEEEIGLRKDQQSEDEIVIYVRRVYEKNTMNYHDVNLRTVITRQRLKNEQDSVPLFYLFLWIDKTVHENKVMLNLI